MVIHNVVAFVLLLDEIVIYSAGLVFGRGAGLGVIFLLLCVLCFYKIKTTLPFLITALALIFQLAVDFQVINIFFLLIYLAHVVVSSAVKKEMQSTEIYGFVIVAIFFCSLTSWLGHDIFSYITGAVLNRPTGLYSEPSHLAYYVAIAYYLHDRFSQKKREIINILAIATILMNFSLTGLLPLAYISFKIQQVKGYPYLKFFLMIAVFIALYQERDYLFERIAFDHENLSLTLGVLIYYWKMIFNEWQAYIFVGTGYDQFHRAYLEYANLNGLMIADLNSTDGSFLFAKLLFEIGLISSLVFILKICFSIRNPSFFIFLLFMQFLFLRGFPITSSVVMLMIVSSLMLAPNNTLKRESFDRN